MIELIAPDAARVTVEGSAGTIFGRVLGLGQRVSISATATAARILSVTRLLVMP